MRPPKSLDAYWACLQEHLTDVRCDGAPASPDSGVDFIVDWAWNGRRHRYYVVVKTHLPVLDASVVAATCKRTVADVVRAKTAPRLLLLAPYVRPQQANALRDAGVDYLDLAGNAHVEVAGLLRYIEGRKPAARPELGGGRPQKAWAKSVLALLAEAKLESQPLRTWCARADVALGSVSGCVRDLVARTLLVETKSGRAVTDRAELVALWVEAYCGALRPRLEARRFQVQAADRTELLAKLRRVMRDCNERWAVTGAAAAEARDRYFHTAETEIYAPVRIFENRDIQRALVAQPARDGNLLVIEPPGPSALPDVADDATPFAPDVLVYAELKHRRTSQAEEAARLVLTRVLDAA